MTPIATLSILLTTPYLGEPIGVVFTDSSQPEKLDQKNWKSRKDGCHIEILLSTKLEWSLHSTISFDHLLRTPAGWDHPTSGIGCDAAFDAPSCQAELKLRNYGFTMVLPHLLSCLIYIFLGISCSSKSLHSFVFFDQQFCFGTNAMQQSLNP